MNIRITVSVASVIACSAAGVSLAQDHSGKENFTTGNWPPKPYPLSRYEPAWSRNPFNLKTVPVPVEAAVPLESFAKNLAVAGVSQVGEQKTLILIDRRTSQYHRVTKEPNSAGLRLVSLQNNPDIRKVVARIAKGTEEAEIRYAEPSARKPPSSKSPASPSPDRPAGETTGRKEETPDGSGGEASESTDGRK